MKINYDESLAFLNPELSSEWNFKKNYPLTPADVKPNNTKSVWWKCLVDGYEWSAPIAKRHNGRKCPVCTNQVVMKGINDLSTTNPQLAKEWHPTKNVDISIDKVGKNSSKKAWWLCENGHYWKAVIAKRNHGRGCPYCSNKDVWVGDNDLSTTHPEIAAEWDYELNDGLLPTGFTRGAEKKVWWRCNEGHSWKARIADRCKKNGSATGCSQCNSVNSAKKVLEKLNVDTSNIEVLQNNITITHPELSAEWHPTKNEGLRISDVSYGSIKKVWWKCSQGHEWQAPVYSRTSENKNGCPICSKHTGTSFSEQAVLFYISKIFDLADGRVIINGTEADIFIPTLNLAIEYDGVYYHKDIMRDIKKNELLKDVNLIRIREAGLPIIEDFNCKNFQLTKNNPSELGLVIEDVIKHIRSSYELSPCEIETINNMHIDVVLDTSSIMSQYIVSKKKNSLLEKRPDLAFEWHPTKNGDLTPDKVTCGSNTKVFWMCEKGHEWDSSINNRVKGCGCRICGNKELLVGFNDLATMYPEVAEQWHPTKNGNITPNAILCGGKDKYWWIDHKGKESFSSVDSRTRKYRIAKKNLERGQ